MITEEKNELRHEAMELAKKVKVDNPELFDDEDGGPSFKCSPAVLFDRTLTSKEQQVYLVVQSLVQVDGICFESQTTIGKLANFKERANVVRALQRLESKLFLKSARLDFKQKVYLIIPSHVRYPFLNDLDASGKKKKRNSFEYLTSEQYTQEINAYLKSKT
jgi:hypothetical protein